MSQSISTIPAGYFVGILPSVLAAGSTGLSLSELMLTTDTRIPIGSVLSFSSANSVSAYCGAASVEYAQSLIYFAGYSTGTIAPSNLLIAQYPLTAVSAYIRGATLGYTLAQLQALSSGTLIITVNGTQYTSSSISLSGVTSFSAAASTISAALGVPAGATQATATCTIGGVFTATASGTNLTISAVSSGYLSVGDTISGVGVTAGTTIVSQTSGTPGGDGVYVTSAATTISNNTLSASSYNLHVNSPGTGTIAIGQQLTGTSITGNPYVTAFQTGTGGVGVYTLTSQQGIASETVTFVTPSVSYDSISGAFVITSSTTGTASTVTYCTGTLATTLNLTAATGAVLSQGAAAAVPATFMSGIIATTTNFATFQTLFDPDNGSGNAQKQLFAAWVNSQNNRYLYIANDTDINPTLSTTATTSLGYILNAAGSSGTCPIYDPQGYVGSKGSFVAAYAASINFAATNGRATAAYKSQSGLVPSVTNQTTLVNLIANGYNAYVSTATANASWNFLYPGQVTGTFLWLDSYLNQIWLNNQCQIALMNLQTLVGRIPYNSTGYGFIRSALTAGAASATIALPPQSPVAAAVNNGVITQGVPLSATQVIAVNNLAGVTSGSTAVTSQLQTQGWYLVIQPATAAIRQARQSPVIILLYMDGGSVQQINLSSILVF